MSIGIDGSLPGSDASFHHSGSLADRVHPRTTRELASIVVPMKLAMLRHALLTDRRNRWIFRIFLAVGVLAGLFGAFTFFRDGREVAEAWPRSLVPGFTLLFAGWTFGPLLLGGIDDSIDATRLALLGLDETEVVRAISISSLLGVLPLASVVALAGVLGAHSTDPESGLLTLAACVVLLAMSLSASRSLSVGLALARRSRRGRDAAVLLASLTAAAIWFSTQSLRILELDDYDRVVAVLRWLPPGVAAQAIVEVRNHRSGSAWLLLALAAGWSVLAAQLWRRGLRALLGASEARIGPTARASDSGRYEPTTLLAAAVRHEFRYLRRSPQRRAALLVGMVIGGPFALLQAWQPGGVSDNSVFFAPLAMLFGIGMANNLLGLDAPSLWLYAASATPERLLLTARSIAAVPYLVAPVFVSGLVLALLSGSWWQFVVMLVLVIASTGIPVGVGMLLSVIVPFAQLDNDDPFASQRPPAGEGCLIAVLGVIGLVGSAVLLLPVLVMGWKFDAHQPVGLAVTALFSGFVSLTWWMATRSIALRRSGRMVEHLLETTSYR